MNHIYEILDLSLVNGEDGTVSWSRDFTAEFIDLYRSVETVWNIKCKEYTDRGKKARAYDLLVAKVRTVDPAATRETVVKKINCLRSSFRKEVKKVNKSKNVGELYVPRLWYYNRLAFLESHEVEAPPADSNTDDEQPDDVHKHKEVTNGPDVGFGCETTVNVKRPPSPVTAVSSQSKKRQKDDMEDRFDIVGKMVAAKLRSLSNQQRIYAEKLINDVLFEAELNTLGRGCRVVVPGAD